MEIHANLLETLGNTPLVELGRFSPTGAMLAVKLESFNPGSSVKDRIGIAMISAAEESGRVNQYGVGSLLELQQGASYQPRMVESPITHFGIGKHEQADVLRILWTNGIPHSLIQPQGNQLITEQQTLKGSCPYLYAWDGEQFTFVTDLLWAAPIGLQTATAEIMPDRPWEYLKISGDQLKPADGQYRLQITEELWEAAYFDQVELIAVDHPADVDSNPHETSSRA